MYFCQQCNYTLDINKKSGIKDDNRIELKKPLDAIKKLSDDINFIKFKPLFSKNELIKNKDYKKLKDNEKKKLNKLFSNIISNAEFICDNCGFKEDILETISLYKIDNSEDSIIKTLEDNKLLVNDPTLPRTKDYLCKNNNCISHKDKKNKEAVYYRDKNSFELNYICVKCYYSWKV